MKIINPATGEVIEEIHEMSIEAIASSFAECQQAQPSWANLPLEKRIAILEQFRTLLQRDADELAAILTSEVGKPLSQSRNEIRGACHRIEWLCRHAARYLSDEIMHEEQGLTEKIVYEPLGVVANISAWNYPYLVGVNVIVPALLAGNAVLYKPSELASLTGKAIGQRLQEAGLPKGLFHVIIGAAAAGEALLELPLDGYFFTGSYKTGKYIYERVAPKMVPCQCELGGKDPLYVTDDITDIKAVAAATADGAFYNNGQSCCSVERIYVHESIAEEFIDAFVAEVNSWKLGLPTEEGVYLGPLTRQQQSVLLEQQVADALSKGARLLTGGKRVQRSGNYFEPTVLVNVTQDMRVMREESFGPIIGIMQVKDDNDAVEKMKDTEYGLTASVYSSSEGRANRILKQLDAGTGYWNCCDRVSPALPWSGRRHSGFGATLSHAGLRAFTRPKAYHLRQQ
ncbi:MAG: aldehyde dehydrogenase family protein [Chitinophagaceae bacterium]